MNPIRRLGQRLRDACRRDPVEASRWVVIDLETSGFDSARDHLLAIGAVALHEGRVAVQDSFEMLVRPPVASDRENILVHRIGAQAQLSASDPEQACHRLRQFLGDSPLAAFHAPFDRAFLLRDMKTQARIRLANPWLDLADLAPALFPQVGASSLDDWLGHFGIMLAHRHHAASDAFGTAILFARLLAEVPAPQRTLDGLLALAQRRRNARHGH